MNNKPSLGTITPKAIDNDYVKPPFNRSSTSTRKYDQKNTNQHVASQPQAQKQQPRRKQKKGLDQVASLIENLPKQTKLHGHGRKNQISINHLLDFQSYRDLEEYQHNHSRRRPSGGSRPRNRDVRTRKVHLSGMSFINVNYKFVVDTRKDYKEQALDPNIPPDTDDIIRIIVPKGNACPICLSDDPIAPRMISSCGHIVCLKCLLSLLESEVPTSKKKESSAIVEKYRECPLCLSIIRKNEVKPVLINNIDERFETPKIDDDVVLTLMTRPLHKILPLPQAIHEYHDVVGNFPMVNQTNPDFNQYLRIFKGDLDYLLKMYATEKQQILENYEEEKLVYNEPDTYFKMAIAHIDAEISNWSHKLAQPVDRKDRKRDVADTGKDNSSTFYFYQTGFNSNATYVLSPLDIKVVKAAYHNSYEELPSSIVAKIENIRYDELSPETSMTKYKYLSHLPSGTQLGFLECNWNNNEFLSDQAWNTFKDDLSKRTKNSKKKLNREERDRKRAQDEEEKRTKNFYARENGTLGNETEEFYERGNFGTLSIVDHRELPALLSEDRRESAGSADSEAGEYVSTVWGTKIPKAEFVDDVFEDEDDWDAEEMIRKAKEEMERQEAKGKGKKKKKKLVLLSSNTHR
ncbi:uncharacterized protein CANTADRAFT_26814 [Suhomyces tanzawaensis NRRL Y-17324]|uniref:RING-type domain-containing protein n=1 Tax=Suhomyces tanzawaensis NRRL Y-17324 TaxID=984487 RepID=A0A1E4SDZ3_9ASCO|nr:uncharacterized protein CANTADRAFT_26814 [Suhomyces tanzawaensis NRRL Y-17324]ODV77739.1 hypothetical protein CANTADRAFT_26814 [Suhomyces tanzawaensis NRRL Y-17324]